jgi:uncharacterized membrane protein YedE/YeeE
MEKLLKYLLFGIVFGILLYKSEVASWFRIQEMFRFHSFHMYGVIMSAIGVGAVSVQVLKRFSKNQLVHDLTPSSNPITKAHFFGGIMFGIGWAFSGACPGPIYTLIGAGYHSFWVVLAGALVGAFTFGVIKGKPAESTVDQCGETPVQTTPNSPFCESYQQA